MGLFDKLMNKVEKEHIDVDTEKNTLYLPIEGEVIALADIADGVFSEGVLGQGCGIRPKEEKVFAPASGEITVVAETKHAIGMTTEDGAEVLIHVGLDTVDMKGDGFSPQIKVGDRVKCGDLLMTFQMNKIKAAGHPATTAFIVTNLNDIEVLVTGDTKKLSPVMKCYTSVPSQSFLKLY